MAPEARREMVVDAALPLILEHGERVTKPYDHQIVLDRIRRLLAARERGERAG